MSKDKQVKNFSVRTGTMPEDMYNHVLNRIEGRTFKEYAYELFEKDMEQSKTFEKLDEIKTELKAEVKQEMNRHLDDIKDLIRMLVTQNRSYINPSIYNSVAPPLYDDEESLEGQLVAKEVVPIGEIEEETDYDF
ncbi:hypothetical protein [Niallia taxi]|uniref:hypothetical protein n=1 Tax=Niallia taxi TaxID=2499688 RepID=UPI0015F62160|nr:hypothetical protein [Niallia taxi]